MGRVKNPLHKRATDFLFIGPNAVLDVEDGGVEGGEDAFDGDAFAASVGTRPEVIFPKDFWFPLHTLLYHIGHSPCHETVVTIVGVGEVEGDFNFGAEHFCLLVGAGRDESLFASVQIFEFDFVNGFVILHKHLLYKRV